MKGRTREERAGLGGRDSVSEILILPDGKILAHNVSVAMAGVLAELDPTDAEMSWRANRLKHELPN